MVSEHRIGNEDKLRMNSRKRIGLLRLIVMIDMHSYALYVCEILFVMFGLRGAGVLTCMTNPEAQDIWLLPYVRIMVPTCQNSDVFG